MPADLIDPDFPPADLSASWVSELEALVETSALSDLRLVPVIGGNRWSADLMLQSRSRPPVGVQGTILDAMDDGRISVPQAGDLLGKVNRRIQKETQEAPHGR